MNSEGKHVIIDAFECDSDLLNNETYLEPLLVQVAQDLKLKVLRTYFYPFHPQGLTGMIVLASSHISIHTWPEERYAALDIFTCGEQDPIDKVEFLLKGISSKRARIQHISRGVTKQSIFQEFQWSHASTLKKEDNYEAYFENKWDIIGLNEILNGKHRKVFNGKSKYQTIQVVEAPDLRLYLDGQLQFSSLDERIYHEAIVHPALTLAANHESILIIGGGDGLALREILKYPDVKQVTLVDLDPLVIDAAKYVPSLTSLNQYSLHNFRVTIHIQDAAAFLASNPILYDVIIVDLPDPTNRRISDLYTMEFYSQLRGSLAKDGLFVSQAASLDQTPVVYWSIGKTIERAGFQTHSYHVMIPSFGDWGFHIGSKESIVWEEKQVQVPHPSLPSKLKDLTYFPPKMTEPKNLAIVNSMNNSILHLLSS